MLFKKNKPLEDSTAAEQNHYDYPNMETCLKRLDQILQSNAKGAVVKVYLENFKAFNDTFGFQFGGLLIGEICGYLRGLDGAEVFRTAGVEFIVILDGASHAKAQQIAEEIAARFDSSWHVNNMDCMATMNAGIAYYPGHAASGEEMMDNLGHAVSESADMGHNQIIVFDEELKKKIFRKNSIARDISKALEENRVEVRYRPSYHVQSKRFTRAECYVRLFHEDLGFIPSAEFIPIAEESGQIYAVSNYMIQKVCKAIRAFLDDDVDFENIAVPISPIQFLQEHFLEDVDAALQEAGIPADKLAFEISESVTLSSHANAQICVNELADRGIGIVLTDFGTGYSGINSIMTIPVDTVKLERLFVYQMDNDDRVPHIIEGLIFMARKLGLKVIAEGVETENQVALLEKYGCEYEQGFYYTPTLTQAELKETLQKQTS